MYKKIICCKFSRNHLFIPKRELLDVHCQYTYCKKFNILKSTGDGDEMLRVQQLVKFSLKM